MTASNWDPTKYPIPRERELLIRYNAETDILTLWNGTPASNCSPIARDLAVFFDEEDEAQIVTLENAAALLKPYLFPEALRTGTKGTKASTPSSSVRKTT